MKKLTRLALFAALTGGTLLQSSCTTDLRDAVLAGLYDYVAGTTTDLITTISPFDDLAADE